MAWTDINWSQDDDKNFGLPFITDTGLSEKADLTDSKTIWSISESENFGFPFITYTGLSEKADLTNVKSIWAFSDEINFGFPYIREVYGMPFPFTIFVGRRQVSEIYIGTELIFSEASGTNKIQILE